MSFPRELLQYAENLYRRFPEEFLALGAPGLEEIYDLRPNGTWTRCIQETHSEKIVEIKLHRWQRPDPMAGGYQNVMPQAYPDPMAGGYQNVMPQQAMWQQPPFHSAQAPAMGWHPGPAMGHSHSSYAGAVPQTPHVEARSEPPVAITSCLSRLETALSVLAPQIQALHAKAVQGPAYMAPAMQIPQQAPTSPGAGSSSDKTLAQTAPMGNDSDGKAVRESLALQTSAEAALQKKDKVRRLEVNVNAVRVAPGLGDPQSPRSPGRYSAWK